MTNAATSAQSGGTHGEYVRGSMEISDQEQTWQTFGVWAKWGSIHVLALTFFLIFWLVGGMPIVVAGASIGILVGVVAWFFGSRVPLCLAAFAGYLAASVLVAIVVSIFMVLAG